MTHTHLTSQALTAHPGEAQMDLLQPAEAVDTLLLPIKALMAPDGLHVVEVA